MKLTKNFILLNTVALIFVAVGITQYKISPGNEYHSISLKSQISGVQPMTGIVFWEELDNKETDAIQLEYSYMRYNDVVKEKGVYDWFAVEEKLNSASNRFHQIILRFWDTYPGHESSVPDYIKALSDY